MSLSGQISAKSYEWLMAGAHSMGLFSCSRRQAVTNLLSCGAISGNLSVKYCAN